VLGGVEISLPLYRCW